MKRRLVLTIGLTLATLLVSAGCNPTIITARFPDGSPSAFTELTSDHVDYDPVLWTDKLCALPYGPDDWMCINWRPPTAHEWHRHDYWIWVGLQCCGRWYRVDLSLSDWHMWYEWWYWPDDHWSAYWAYAGIAGETNFGRGCIYCGEDNAHHPY